MKLSNYIVYADEAGDHSLSKVDAAFPVFVLSLCVFGKDEYADKIVPAMTHLKFRTFGHDMVVLHERDIVKRQGPFSAMGREAREAFVQDLSRLIEEADFTLIASVIRKLDLTETYLIPDNPYYIGLRDALEQLYLFLQSRQQADLHTFVVFEARGRREDNELELEFRRVCAGTNAFRQRLPLEIVFASKQRNSTGLQIADMTARPIGLREIRPGQENRALEVLRKKLWRRSAATWRADDAQNKRRPPRKS